MLLGRHARRLCLEDLNDKLAKGLLDISEYTI